MVDHRGYVDSGVRLPCTYLAKLVTKSTNREEEKQGGRVDGLAMVMQSRDLPMQNSWKFD